MKIVVLLKEDLGIIGSDESFRFKELFGVTLEVGSPQEAVKLVSKMLEGVLLGTLEEEEFKQVRELLERAKFEEKG